MTRPTPKSERKYALHDMRFGRYGFFYFTGAFFALSLFGHWLFGWLAYVNDQAAHNAQISAGDYALIMLRDTLENWQSEFLQLIWQVAGLAFLLHIGSPQSKEGDDRKEAKLDAILEAVDPKNGKDTVAKLDQEFQRTS
ncbi:DUF6766 family protein [Taklimakanibacter deserti]|uniref:DUF6766 family protein n=1 Tax=Taklimakanibacter deserti TaxID=2267839 RepID=UPI0034D6FFBA